MMQSGANTYVLTIDEAEMLTLFRLLDPVAQALFAQMLAIHAGTLLDGGLVDMAEGAVGALRLAALNGNPV